MTWTFFDENPKNRGKLVANKLVTPENSIVSGELFLKALFAVAGYVDDYEATNTVDELFERITHWHPFFQDVPDILKEGLRKRVEENPHMPPYDGN